MDILIAEDDYTSRRMLQIKLEKWGHNITAASNGQEAMDFAREKYFPLILSDWMMPEKNGIDLLKYIRDLPGKRYSYFILITAKQETENIISGIVTGADDYMTKPYNFNELEARILAGQRIVELEDKLKHQNDELMVINDRMKTDLMVAAKFQQSLLPKNIQPVEGITTDWKFQPCEELAGDIFNVIDVDDKTRIVYLLDVSGHGVASALIAVTLNRILSLGTDQSIIIDHESGKAASPSSVAQNLNQQFQIDTTNGLYFTLVYGIFNLETMEFRYISAGHPGVLHITNNQLSKPISATGIPIGFTKDYSYKEKSIHLKLGDKLLLYSDGVTEAINVDGNLYGDERLTQLFKQSGIKIAMSKILDILKAWTAPKKPGDDVSVFGIEVH